MNCPVPAALRRLRPAFSISGLTATPTPTTFTTQENVRFARY